MSGIRTNDELETDKTIIETAIIKGLEYLKSEGQD